MNENSPKHSILIVEDDVQICGNLTELFGLRDFQVRFAYSGFEALGMIQAEMPNVVVSDVKMPGMSGIELLKEVRKNLEYANLPFIFLTAKIETSDLREGMDAGADDYLFKPAKFDDIYRAVMYRLERSIQIESQKFFGVPLPATIKHTRLEMEQVEKLLSNREMEVFKLIVTQKSTKEIADRLFVSKKTIDNHRYNIMQKLNITGNNGLLKYSMKFQPAIWS